jgi:hypothetical protein
VYLIVIQSKPEAADWLRPVMYVFPEASTVIASARSKLDAVPAEIDRDHATLIESLWISLRALLAQIVMKMNNSNPAHRFISGPAIRLTKKSMRLHRASGMPHEIGHISERFMLNWAFSRFPVLFSSVRELLTTANRQEFEMTNSAHDTF